MKFFVSVFLLILSPFSLIKIVHSIECYVTDNAALQNMGASCVANLAGELKDENPDDKDFSKIFACIRNGLKANKGTPCISSVTECLTLTTELKDQTQLMIKGCRKGNSCEQVKSVWSDSLGSIVGNFIQDSHCAYCSTDNCNNQQPKSDPHLRSLSVVSSPPATAFIIVSIIIIHLLF